MSHHLRTGVAVLIAYALGFSAGAWAAEATYRREYEKETRQKAQETIDRIHEQQERELDRIIRGDGQ